LETEVDLVLAIAYCLYLANFIDTIATTAIYIYIGNEPARAQAMIEPCP
jgi:hypothetical protein